MRRTKVFDPSLETAGKNANIAAIALGIGGTALAITGIIVSPRGLVVPSRRKTATPVARLTLTPWISAGCSAAARDCSSRRHDNLRRARPLRSGAMRLAVRACDAACAGPLGCYKPKIKDGGLRCNLDAGVSKACPKGSSATGHDAVLAQPRRGRRSTHRRDVDMQMMEVQPETATCFDARPDCTPDAGLCDPYCQTGLRSAGRSARSTRRAR
jgi:hypothetical protein